MAPEPADTPHSHDVPTNEDRYHDDGGVDVSLIQWMLQLTPEERLRAAQDMLDTVWALRNG
jgi:hypothetical protein